MQHALGLQAASRPLRSGPPQPARQRAAHPLHQLPADLQCSRAVRTLVSRPQLSKLVRSRSSSPSRRPRRTCTHSHESCKACKWAHLWFRPLQGATGGDGAAARAALQEPEDRQLRNEEEQRQQQDGAQPPAYSSAAAAGEAAQQQAEGQLPPKLRRYRPTPGAQRRREQQELPPVEYDPAGERVHLEV